MAEKNNAVCKICGKAYYACLSCKDSMKAHPWKVFTDVSEHYKVFQVIRGLSTGVYAKDEAKERFKNIDLRDIESFRPHIKDIIKDVLKEDKVEVKAVKEDVFVEDVVKAENADEVAKQIVPRKKNYRVETE